MLLVAALCFLTKLIYSSNTNSSCDTQSCEYGCYIDAATNQAICICPVGLTIKAEDLKTCVKIDTQIIFKETPVKIDGTIRPHGDQSKCFYHKMNAQCEKSPKLVIFEKMVFEGLLFSFIFFSYCGTVSPAKKKSTFLIVTITTGISGFLTRKAG